MSAAVLFTRTGAYINLYYHTVPRKAILRETKTRTGFYAERRGSRFVAERTSEKLGIIKAAVKAARFHKLVVAALFYYLAVAKHEYHIGVLYGRKAVGDDKAGAPLHQRTHGFLYVNLRSGIDV